MTTFCDWLSETIMISVYDSFFRNEFFIVLLSWSTIHRRGSYRYVVTLNIDWYVYNSTAYSVSKSVSPRWRKSLNLSRFLLRNYLLQSSGATALVVFMVIAVVMARCVLFEPILYWSIVLLDSVTFSQLLCKNPNLRKGRLLRNLQSYKSITSGRSLVKCFNTCPFLNCGYFIIIQCTMIYLQASLSANWISWMRISRNREISDAYCRKGKFEFRMQDHLMRDRSPFSSSEFFQ